MGTVELVGGPHDGMQRETPNFPYVIEVEGCVDPAHPTASAVYRFREFVTASKVTFEFMAELPTATLCLVCVKQPEVTPGEGFCQQCADLIENIIAGQTGAEHAEGDIAS